MSIDQNEIFYRGYNPSVLLYPGNDWEWILGQTGPSNSQTEGGEEKKLNGIIELRMPLCCDGCVEKVHKKLKALEGVASVECSTEKQKVTVRGEAMPEAVLAAAKKLKPRTEFWEGQK